MDAHRRKIDLQSPSDLTYLLNNIKAVAQEKLDLAIPPSAAPKGEDAYRVKVEELVQEYILQTLTLALPNLTLNGLDPSPTILRPDPAPTSTSEEETGNYEAYDPRLADKLRTLYAEFESQSTRVAELRREAPGAAARRYMERFEEQLRIEREAERDREERRGEVEIEALDLGGFERGEDMQRAWGGATQRLVELGKVPTVLAKLERAGKAVEVVEGM